MIAPCRDSDFTDINRIINAGAEAYRGVIPSDRFHEPYMTIEELRGEIDKGVVFWGYTGGGGKLQGVMGIQDVRDVTLIRHAYIQPECQRRGIGSALLNHLAALAERPILIGTWADAEWAIAFYEKHGFALVSEEEKNRLLAKYWTIPERQIETSVVLRQRGAV